MTSIPHTAEREAMEEWLRRNPDVRFWNSADQMFAAWQARAALAVGEGGQPVAVMEAPKDWIGGLTTYAPHQANKGGMQRGGDYVRLADVIVAYAGSLAPPASPAEQAATQAEFHNPWRTSLENCISGDNYLRAGDYAAPPVRNDAAR